MNIYIHNIYITNKIVYTSAADSSSRFSRNYNLEKMDQSFSQRTRPRAIQNLPPQAILKRLRQFTVSFKVSKGAVVFTFTPRDMKLYTYNMK